MSEKRIERSMPGLRKPTVSELVAERMKVLIKDGTWIGELPGVREVMKDLRVSSKPVQDAVAELELEGLVGPSRSGRRREILYQASDIDEDAGEILLLRGSRWQMSNLSREVFQQLMKLVTGMGVKVVEVVGKVDDVQRLSMPKDVVKRAKGRHVVAFDLAHEEVRALLGPDCEILVIGRRMMEDPRASFVAIGLGNVFRHVVKRLFAIGLKRITILPSLMVEAMYGSLVKILAEAYAEGGVEFDVDRVFPRLNSTNLQQVVERLELDPPQIYICMLNDQWCWLTRRFQQTGNKQEVMTLFDDSLFRFFERAPNVCNPVYDDYLVGFSDWYGAVRSGHVPSFIREVRCEFVWEKVR